MFFSQEKFSQSLKMASVKNAIPVFKKGDKLDQRNYQSISLISKISELIKTLMHRSL